MPHAIPTLIMTAAVAVTAVAGETIATAAQQRPAAGHPMPSAASGPLPHRTVGDTAPNRAARPEPRPASKRSTAPTIKRTQKTAPRSHASAPSLRRQITRVATAPSGPTRWPALNLAIARIPGSAAESARWVVTDRYGTWGTADWYTGAIYISPRVPQAKLYAVSVHEWSHLLSVRPYRGDVRAAVVAMDRVFGGSGLIGAERAADCMARLQGARWTHYTSCQVSAWRLSAALLLRGSQL
jgi:hypothetical protein